jgi:hypothetical protein
MGPDHDDVPDDRYRWLLWLENKAAVVSTKCN